MTIRTPTAETMLATWNALGARAEALPFTEVYSALEQGVIDGQENPLETTYFNSLHEVAPYITTTGHVYGNYHFLVWGEWMDSLDEQTREVIVEAARAAAEEASQISAKNEETLVETMASEGVTFLELEDREAWITATEQVIEEADPTVQDWVTRIRE
jgi:TRAP-type C4-dicarboxylate transport system substrate-binding protein